MPSFEVLKTDVCSPASWMADNSQILWKGTSRPKRWLVGDIRSLELLEPFCLARVWEFWAPKIFGYSPEN